MARLCLPVLAVLAVVVVSTVTDVSMGGAGLPVALRLVLTGVQVAGVSAAFPVVSCGIERELWCGETHLVDYPTPVSHLGGFIFVVDVNHVCSDSCQSLLISHAAIPSVISHRFCHRAASCASWPLNLSAILSKCLF